MGSKFTEKDIEEMLCILEFNKMLAENYRHICNFPNEEKKKDGK
jgi:hypothetical protein